MDWTFEPWEGVIRSGEYSVEKTIAGQQMWPIFPQPPEKLFQDCIAPKP